MRRRALVTLFVGVALASIGYLASTTVSTLVALEMTGNAALAGLPIGMSVAGTALGAWLLSGEMARHGRRRGLVLGYLLGTVGGALSLAAALGAGFLLLLVGAVGLGFANAAILLSRYAAADMFARGRRGTALGIVVWGSTAGAVIGPNLMDPGARMAEALGLYGLAGPYLLVSVILAAATVLATTLRQPDLPQLDGTVERDGSMSVPDAARTIGTPHLIVALAGLIGAQMVMVAIMTMAPVHLHREGVSLAFIGLLLSAHTFGMFAPSPLSGRLTDRFGSLAVILGAMALLAISSAIAALAPATSLLMLGALFGLGLGWNVAYVGGSTLLTHGRSLVSRARLQGRSDALVWASSALSSGASGVLLAMAGFSVLGAAAAAVVAIPVAIALSQRHRLPASSA